MAMTLDKVIPWGRSKREYELMFALTPEDLSKKILGCADGPASFNAEVTEAGGSVTSLDPVYQFSGPEIEKRFLETVDHVCKQVLATPDDWVWTFHRSPEDLKKNRFDVMARFQRDYAKGKAEGRYLTQELPTLDFPDRSFGLALCSHFLFLYSDHFSEKFHVDSALELCRLADDVRIFPLLALSKHRSPYIDAVSAAAMKAGFEARVVKVAYELQKGGNEMLQLRRRN